MDAAFGRHFYLLHMHYPDMLELLLFKPSPLLYFCFIIRGEIPFYLFYLSECLVGVVLRETSHRLQLLVSPFLLANTELGENDVHGHDTYRSGRV